MDISILREMNSWLRAHPGFWGFLGTDTAVALLVVSAAAFLLLRRRYALALTIALAVGASDLTCSRLLKPAFERERPCASVSAVETVGDCGSGSSMPSCHAANTAALGFAAGNAWMVIFAGLVGASRVVLGQHWASDVLAGWVLGGVIGQVGASVGATAVERYEAAARKRGKK